MNVYSKNKARYLFEKLIIFVLITIAWYQLVLPYLSFNSVTISDNK